MPADVEAFAHHRLELVGAAARREHLEREHVQLARHAQLDEQLHLRRRKANEVQIAAAFADLDRVQLHVHVAEARLAVGRVAHQIVAYGAQYVALLLLLVLAQVERLEVDELDKRAADVDAKPRKHYTYMYIHIRFAFVPTHIYTIHTHI